MKKGFTLIELMIAMILIGVLTSVSLPVLSKISQRAQLTEAVAALGSIKTAEKTYYLQNDNRYKAANPIAQLDGIGPNDLEGTYYKQNAYYVETSNGNTTYWIYCQISKDTQGSGCMPRYTGPGSAYIRMNERGDIQTQGIDGSGYPGFSE